MSAYFGCVDNDDAYDSNNGSRKPGQRNRPMLYVATTDIPDFVHYLDLLFADRQDPIELDLSPIYETTEETAETTEQTE